MLPPVLMLLISLHLCYDYWQSAVLLL